MLCNFFTSNFDPYLFWTSYPLDYTRSLPFFFLSTLLKFNKSTYTDYSVSVLIILVYVILLNFFDTLNQNDFKDSFKVVLKKTSMFILIRLHIYFLCFFDFTHFVNTFYYYFTFFSQMGQNFKYHVDVMSSTTS